VREKEYEQRKTVGVDDREEFGIYIGREHDAVAADATKGVNGLGRQRRAG